MTAAEPVGSVTISERMFALGGEMGKLMQQTDWSQTPLGAVAEWPQSLRTAVSICLTSRFPMLIWWGPELTMLYNDAYQPILGAKHPRSMGQAGLECWAEIEDIIGPMLRRVQTTGDATWSVDQLLPLQRKGFAEECYFTFSYSPILDETGGVGGIFTAVTETTQRVIGERRMDLLRRLAAQAAEVSDVGDVCARAARILELDAADIPFAGVYLLDYPAGGARLVGACGVEQDLVAAPGDPGDDDRSAWRDALWQVAETRSPLTLAGLTEKLRRAGCAPDRVVDRALVVPIELSGQERPFGALVAGLSDHLELSNDYTGFLGLVAAQLASLIASARAHEEERRRAEALAELDRAKTVFFSNVSHEFRTPLTLLLGPIDDALTSGARMPKAVRAQLEVARRNGQRLLKLVNTLLEFSRLEAGRLQAEYAPTDLCALTIELASVFRSLIEKAGLRFTVECDSVEAPVYVDRDMWEKIVLNLLSNAFKFTFDGEIAVRLRDDGEAVTLEVSDTGIGIAQDDLPHVFERFHRIQGARSRSYEGSGIGLALVQELARLHGGSISVFSAPGAGARFLVTIPHGTAHLPAEHVRPELATAPAPTTTTYQYLEEAGQWLGPAESAEATGAATHGRGAEAVGDGQRASFREERGYILLADDNADMRAYLERLLSERWDVVAVSNGRAALDAARRRRPSLILSDVMMPEMDGLMLTQAVRADPGIQNTPIILLSARAGQEAAVEGLEAGADDYLVKPFSRREALARVASHLELARLRERAGRQAAELSAVFDAMTDAVLVYDPSGSIVHQNRAALRLLPSVRASGARATTGIVLRDAEGDALPDERQPWRRILAGEALAGQRSVNVFWQAPGKPLVELNASGAPVRDDAGEIVCAILALRDVTAQRAAERRRQTTLDALFAMTEALVSTPETAATEGEPGEAGSDPVARRLAELTARAMSCDAVAIVPVESDTLLLHPAAMVGVDSESARQWATEQPALRLTDYVRDRQTLTRLLAGEPTRLDLTGPDYENAPTFGMRVALLVLMATRQHPVGILALGFRDAAREISDDERSLAVAIGTLAAQVIVRDHLLREREMARADVLALRRTSQRMDEFLGVASHELRTPLTSIHANIQFGLRQAAQLRALEAARSEELSHRVGTLNLLLERTFRQVGRLDRLVGDLLDVSRIQAGKLSLDRTLTDLRAVVLDAIQEQQAAWPGRVIAAETPDRAIPVVADANRMEQVITNFLTNALKYSPPQTPVVVRAEVDGGVARIAVRDEGPGIPSDEQARIWERFHRVPGIEQQSGSGIGLGLGLFICASIMERHGGTVGLESSPGAGSTFWCTLPLSDERPDETEDGNSPSS